MVTSETVFFNYVDSEILLSPDLPPSPAPPSLLSASLSPPRFALFLSEQDMGTLAEDYRGIGCSLMMYYNLSASTRHIDCFNEGVRLFQPRGVF